MKRVLFVDDEEFVLRTLESFMRRMGDGWQAEFTDNGPDALARMERNGFDILISDMRMPGMNGAELLNEVMRRHPRTARVVLSGHADERDVLEAIGVAHQWLAKPCPLGMLKSVLEGIARFQRRLKNPELVKLTGRLKHLPSVPAVYQRITDALQSPNCSTQMIGAIIAEDIALAAKVLHLCNSAFFGFAQTVYKPEEAVQLLGVSRVRSLALMQQIFSAFSGDAESETLAEKLRQHCLHTGWLAQQVVELQGGEPHKVDQAFTAGLLHDVGHLMLLSGDPDVYKQARALAHERGCPVYKAELEALKATHADLGAYLLTLWGLPLPLVEAVAFHHEPAKAGDPTFAPLTAVHVADIWSREQLGRSPGLVPSEVDMDYLKQLQLDERVPYWRKQLCLD